MGVVRGLKGEHTAENKWREREHMLSPSLTMHGSSAVSGHVIYRQITPDLKHLHFFPPKAFLSCGSMFYLGYNRTACQNNNTSGDSFNQWEIKKGERIPQVFQPTLGWIEVCSTISLRGSPKIKPLLPVVETHPLIH